MEVAVIWSAIRGGLSAAWSFVSKPPGSYLAAAGALALVLWWFGQHEFNRGRSACETAHKAATAKVVTIWRDRVVPVSEKRTDVGKAADERNKTRVVYIKEKAHEQPTASVQCVSPDLADKLRDIE